MLRRTKALLIEDGTLVLPPLTELTVSDSLLKNSFPSCCVLLFIFFIYFQWFLQDGATHTVTKEALFVSFKKRATNTSFFDWRIVSPSIFAKHCNSLQNYMFCST
jgi:hypothetical protein